VLSKLMGATPSYLGLVGRTPKGFDASARMYPKSSILPRPPTGLFFKNAKRDGYVADNPLEGVSGVAASQTDLETGRRPFALARLKSRPCLIRRVRDKPSGAGGGASMSAARTQTGVRRLRPTRRRLLRIALPLLEESEKLANPLLR